MGSVLPFQDGDGLPSTAVLRDTEALGGDWGFRRSHHMALVFSLQDRTDCRRPPSCLVAGLGGCGQIVLKG